MAIFPKDKIDIQTEPIKNTRLSHAHEKCAELALDIYENEKEMIVVSLVAGIKESELDISFEKGMLVIKGKRLSPIADQDEHNYLTKECYWGSFARRVVLPDEIDESRIQASLKEGLLVIRIPKVFEKETKAKIKIND